MAPLIWNYSEDKSIRIESLTSATLDGAVEVLRDSFFPNENVCIATDMLLEPGASRELEKLFVDTAKDGVSVVAINTSNGEVVGVAFNKIQLPNDPSEKSYFGLFSETCVYESSKALVDFMIDVDAQVDLFKQYNVNCILEITVLATKTAYYKQGIAGLLVSSTLKLGEQLAEGEAVKVPIDENPIKNLDAIPLLASALMTSNYSQKVAKNFSFDIIKEISYNEFEYKGRKYSDKISKEHQTTLFVAKRLTSG